MPQKITAAINAQGQLVISGEGVKFELVSVADPPPVDPPPVDPPPVDPPPVDPPPAATSHIWVDVATLPGKPRTGRGWNNMYSMAKGGAPGPVTVANQNSMNSAWMQACSYVYAATGNTNFLAKVIAGFQDLISPSLPIDRALALAREVQGYVLAAEGAQLQNVDADLYAAVKAKFRYFLTCKTSSGPSSLLESHRKRPNNWGTHATSAVLMIARYIGDKTVFDGAINVFRGYLGDYDLYHDFVYGDLAWQYEKARPLGINRKGARINDLDVDGGLPEELRRGSTDTSDYPGGDAQMYTWEALQGVTAAMLVALNAGLDLRPVGDYAHRRAVDFALNVVHWPIQGDDAWQAPVLNYLYPDLKLAIPIGSPGKGVAWTEFSHT